MATKTTAKELERRDRQIRRLYALVWLLACPLAFILVRLLGFEQIHIVYWTLLVVPVLLGIYNVRQVPPVRGKAVPTPTGEDTGDSAEESAQPEPAEGITRLQHTRMLGTALRIPVTIALPILITVVVDLCIQLRAAR